MLFKDKKVRDAISQFHGTEYNKVMGWFIDRFAGVDQRHQIAALDRAVNRLAKGILYIKPAIGIKQTFSTLLYTVDMPTSELAKNLTMMSVNPKLMKDVYKDISTTTTWKNRGEQGFNLDIVTPKKEHDYRYRNTKIGKAKRELVIKADKLYNRIPTESMDFLAGAFIRYGDKTPILLGGGAYYLYKKGVYEKTMSKEKAKEKALEDFERTTQNTQQSTRVSNISYARGSSSVGRAVFMFTSGAGQVHRLVASAYREIAQGRNVAENIKNIMYAHVILGGMYGLASNALKWDDEEMAWSVSLGNIKGIAGVGQTVSFLKDKIQGKPWAKSLKVSSVIDNLANILTYSIDLSSELSKEFPDEDKAKLLGQKLALEIATARGLPAKGGVQIYESAKDIALGEAESPVLYALGLENKYAEGVSLFDVFKVRPRARVNSGETEYEYIKRRKEEDKSEIYEKRKDSDNKKDYDDKLDNKLSEEYRIYKNDSSLSKDNNERKIYFYENLSGSGRSNKDKLNYLVEVYEKTGNHKLYHKLYDLGLISVKLNEEYGNQINKLSKEPVGYFPD